MYSYALLLVAVIDASLLVWSVRAWLDDRRNNALLLQTILLLLLWFDVLTVAIGGWIGVGPTLELMSRIRYTWFYLTMPLLLIGVGALARQADFAWAKPKWVIGLICIVATYFIVRDVPRVLVAEFQVACFADTVRHVGTVAVGEACPGGVEGAGVWFRSLSIPIVFLSVTLMGVLLWVRRGWPWLAISALLFMASTAIPSATVGPFLTYPLDTLMTAAFVITARKFTPSLDVAKT
ncbi:MAG: hypothetical protein EXR11_05610 [Rhodospirillaceae bacterium]|nr:hypothetical protein [Rhodospirillaceae bacterium]